MDGSLSYVEAEGESDQLKAEAKAKELLLKELNLKTWEEAEAAVPEFTKEGVQKFEIKKGKPLPSNFKVSTPQRVIHALHCACRIPQMFCERAKEAKQHRGEQQPQIQTIAEQGNVRVIAAGNLELVQADLIFSERERG